MLGSVERQRVGTGADTAVGDAFAEFAPRIRAALTPLADRDSVEDAVAEAFAYLCANADRVLVMANPGGYLYRVARSHLGRWRKHPTLPPVPATVLPQVEPGLPAALAALSEKQRVAVFLMAGMGWTAAEVATYLDMGESSARTHYDRGLAKLRARGGGAMTPIEDQIRAYAQAITAGEHPRPERREPSRSTTSSHRWAFAVAAAALVVIVAAGAFIGLRTTHDATPVSATATAGDLTTELTVSNQSPASSEVVTATVKVTNHGTESVTVQKACGAPIAVQPAVKVQPFSSGSSDLDMSLETQFNSAFFNPPSMMVREPVTFDELRAALAGDQAALIAKATDCPSSTTTTLGPGESITATKKLALGELGFPAGPGEVATEFINPNGPANATVKVTIPTATTDPISRDQAIRAALADPTVSQVTHALPSAFPTGPAGQQGTVVQSGTNGGGGYRSTEPDTATSSSSILFCWRVADGWQIGWLQADGGFLATVAPDGSVTHADAAHGN
jgi:DNA-directed RNA polymerase specialized sigma24 family protein